MLADALLARTALPSGFCTDAALYWYLAPLLPDGPVPVPRNPSLGLQRPFHHPTSLRGVCGCVRVRASTCVHVCACVCVCAQPAVEHKLPGSACFLLCPLVSRRVADALQVLSR